MRILITYATTEGQTRKICRFAADCLMDLGHSIELCNVREPDELEPGRYDAVILAGSVHGGYLQAELIDFGKTHADTLSELKTLYLQVSLGAAGTDKDEWDDLRGIADKVAEAFGWTPQRTEHIAGAFRFTEYDFFKSWAMRWIASQRDKDIDPHTDTEFTDWEALRAILADWTA